MNNGVTPVSELIPETNIIVFSPHFDDLLFMLGGYINELQKASLLATKNFHILLVFSRSNYLAGAGNDNFDISLDRIKLATGKRLLEDIECTDALLGKFNYKYELLGENECFIRGKNLADSEMEFPHGMYDDFNEQDFEIFERMKDRIRNYSVLNDTALIFPTAFKEHIDHFLVREAAIQVSKEPTLERKATFYFQEDKPYGGIATEVEHERINTFINENKLHPKTYICDPEKVIDLAFKYYISQVEEVYKTGIRERARSLQESTQVNSPCDRLYVYRNK
ncbi:MAG: hypothetical protein ABIN67_21460 [Ferruginibacter sp.]